MYFAREAAARPAYELGLVSCNASSMLVDANDRCVDHLNRRIMRGGERIHDLVPSCRARRLWSRLNVKADEVKHGPAQLEPLAEWVRGIGTAEKLGLLVQQRIGRLSVETFTATAESWAAACTAHEAASSSNVLRMLGGASAAGWSGPKRLLFPWSAALIDQFQTVAVRICGPRVARLTLTERTGVPLSETNTKVS
jgi:hypothetical protein